MIQVTPVAKNDLKGVVSIDVNLFMDLCDGKQDGIEVESVLRRETYRFTKEQLQPFFGNSLYFKGRDLSSRKATMIFDFMRLRKTLNPDAL